MLAWLWMSVAWAGGTWLAVAGPDWDDPQVERRLARRIGASAVVVPATDLVQPGRERAGPPPRAQPGRVDDRELNKLRKRLEEARTAGACGELRAVADAVSFVDRSSVRELRFDALVAAGACEGDVGDDLLALAAALVARDPRLIHRSGAARDRVEALQAELEPTLVEIRDPEFVEVRVDGIVTPASDGRLQVLGKRADVQLVRHGRGRTWWGPSLRVTSGQPARPLELAEQQVGALVSSLPTDGGAALGGVVGAYYGLVDADALYLAVPDKRRLTLWRWEPEHGAFVRAD